ncbi:MAG: hypothetical protein K8E66_06960, partial [Phycisphaerales bacterium]|nr:hypothetical protein [Phycisphaerales bacterium]
DGIGGDDIIVITAPDADPAPGGHGSGPVPEPVSVYLAADSIITNPGCNPADITEPFGLLDLADVTAFIAGFLAQDPVADIDNSGLHDLADITLFVGEFLAGCP